MLLSSCFAVLAFSVWFLFPQKMSSFKASETFKEGLWYHSKLEEGLAYSYKVDKMIFEGTTKFQKIAVWLPCTRDLFPSISAGPS